jgi:hypothetical protein
VFLFFEALTFRIDHLGFASLCTCIVSILPQFNNIKDAAHMNNATKLIKLSHFSDCSKWTKGVIEVIFISFFSIESIVKLDNRFLKQNTKF